MHLLSRCNSLRDSKFRLVRDRGISLVPISSVARKVTMPKGPLELASLVFSTFDQLLSGQEDYHQEEGAREPLWTG